MVQRMPCGAKPTLIRLTRDGGAHKGEVISWMRGIVFGQLVCNGGGDLLIPV